MSVHRSKNLRLASALLRSGLTGKQVAATATIHRTTFSAILNNRSIPKTATARAIAKALDTTPRRLGLEKGGRR